MQQVRKSISPQQDDTWQSIASRELASNAGEETVSQLQSWNMHVFMRPGNADGNPILPSDVIFLEPPLSK